MCKRDDSIIASGEMESMRKAEGYTSLVYETYSDIMKE
jgi:hypothetical protein